MIKRSIDCILLVCICAVQLVAQPKEICFTIDDLPVVSYGINDTSYQFHLTSKLLSALQSHKIPAIGFVNARKLFSDSVRIPFQFRLLGDWLAHGCELGNHTYSHPDYNTTPFADYVNDILKGEEGLRAFLSEKGHALRYFRHPYLHVGNRKEKADSLSAFLSSHQYTVAPVTIDNDDYMFAVVYKGAWVKSDTVRMRMIRSDYLSYMQKKIGFYEKESNALVGRTIPQILLFHASALNADCADELANLFIANGYSFVSLERALEDPAYQTEVTKYGNWGISWLDRWALSAGKGRDFFAGDPEPPEYIVKESKAASLDSSRNGGTRSR
ncbi:MAG: polysaccharide deacetylase family protein [Ignavibacteriales bacterium]|nr:polysaccharide deacetylase family protein [Ignavibacteriales bacterium]